LKTDSGLLYFEITTPIKMNGPIHSTAIDVNQINFVLGQKRAGRNPPINMKYSGANLQVRLPRIGYPGGCLVREGETGLKTYTLIGSLKGCDPYGKERYAGTDEIGKLYNLLSDLEERIIKAAVENSVAWFGKKRSEEAIRDSFKRILSFSTDKVDGEYVPNGKYPPSFRVKVPVYDNKVSSEIVDSNRNPVYVTPETLETKDTPFPKGVEAKLVVSGSIYVIAGQGFGVTWRLTDAQVFPQRRMGAAAIFADEEDDAPTAEVLESEAPADSAPAQEDESERAATPVDQPVQSATPAAPVRKRRVAASS
jgi:hypothetical protein